MIELKGFVIEENGHERTVAVQDAKLIFEHNTNGNCDGGHHGSIVLEIEEQRIILRKEQCPQCEEDERDESFELPIGANVDWEKVTPSDLEEDLEDEEVERRVQATVDLKS